jgi:hypothetical protein
MLDIVSVQRGNILDWFLSDALSFSASAHSCGRMELSSSKILPTHKTSLFHCCAIKKIYSRLTAIGRPRSGLYENEVSNNYAVWCCGPCWMGVGDNLYILHSRRSVARIMLVSKRNVFTRLFPGFSYKTRLTAYADVFQNSTVYGQIIIG